LGRSIYEGGGLGVGGKLLRGHLFEGASEIRKTAGAIFDTIKEKTVPDTSLMQTYLFYSFPGTQPAHAKKIPPPPRRSPAVGDVGWVVVRARDVLRGAGNRC